MAGIGPPPKHPSLRSRQNRASTRALLPPGRPFTPGPLPARFDADGAADPWHQRTVAWWGRVWESPMAGEFLEVDADGLHRLAVLVDLFNWDPTTALAAEIRLGERRFGLTPLDRRSLQWDARPEQPEEPPPRRRKKKRGLDPRRVLRFRSPR